MKLVFLYSYMAQLRVSVAQQDGGKSTGNRNGMFFSSVDVMEHDKITHIF